MIENELHQVGIAYAWKQVRPMRSALARLGFPVEIREGPSLWTSADGAEAASFIKLAAELRPRDSLAELAARVGLDDIAAIRAAWKLDANLESLRAAIEAVLNPQQEPAP